MKNLKHWLKLICLSIFCSLLSGCISMNKYIEKKQYLFNLPTLPTSNHRASAQNLSVHPITISAPFDQNYFIYRISANQYLTDYYHSFLVSPARQLNPVLIDYLKKIGITGHKELSVKITELYADYRDRQNPKAVVTLNFVLSMEKNKKNIPLLDKTFRSAIPLKAKDSDSLVNAWSLGIKYSITTAILSLRKTR